MRHTQNPRISPFVWILIAIFLALLIAWIALKIYIAGTDGREPPADGETVSIFVTGELGGYREPCG